MAHAQEHAHDDHAPLPEGDDLPHHGAVLAEPRSPAWLPYLGGALAALVLVWWLSTPNDAEEAAAAAAAAASASASAAAAAPEGEAKPTPPPTPPPAPQPAPQPPAPQPPGGGAQLPGALKGMNVAPGVDINPHYKKKQ